MDQQRPESKLKYRKWSGDLNIPDPVSISIDNRGRALVTQTARRKIQDLDIRLNRAWIPNDLSFQTVEDRRDFYLAQLKPVTQGGNSDNNKKHVKDVNRDGTHDFRDLTVISEKIHLVQDTNGDGTADQIQLFADEFNSEVTGIAAGVLAFDEDVYATIAPDVWKLKDTTGDGQADERSILATGFGIHIAYAGHDMHGLTIGPDGKIYWTIGDKGISVTSKEGKRFHFPNQGGVLRCNPDGSDFEVFARGLRNVQELAFDQYGNLFGFDNDSDQPQERERFVYLVDGLDAGWRCNYQYRGNDYNPWMAERMWEPLNDRQPAYIVPPIVNSINGPCGFAFNPGTALSDDYRNYFFLTGTIQGEQIAFKIERDGDAFKLVNEHKIGAGTPLIGINFGPDGSLYAVDWGGGYPLNQTGSIWQIDVEKNNRSPLRAETAARLRESFDTTTPANLAELLSHPDQRVRLKAQFELVKRGELEQLKSVANRQATGNLKLLGRIHSIWGLGQLARNDSEQSSQSLATLMSLLDDENSQIRIQLARTIGDIKHADGRLLIAYLNDASLPVRMHTAIALGRLGTADAFEPIVEAAKSAQPNETYLRHAYSAAMAGIESRRIVRQLNASNDSLALGPDRLNDLVNHLDDQVRLIAAVAIRKLAPTLGQNRKIRFELSAWLRDKNPKVAAEIARAIYDDFSIPNEVHGLALAISDTTGDPTEAFQRRALGANFRLGRSEDLKRVASFASDSSRSRALRLEAISMLEKWQTPDPLDRVTGRYRDAIKTDDNLDRELNLAVCKQELIQAFQSNDPTIQSAAIKALRTLKIGLPREQLVQLVNSDLAVKLRIEALNSLVEQSRNPRSDDALKQLVRDATFSSQPGMRAAAIRSFAEIDPFAATTKIEQWLDELQASDQVLNHKRIAPYQTAVLLLEKIGSPGSDEVLAASLTSLNKDTDSLPDSIRLEVLEAAARRATSNKKIKSQLTTLEQKRPSTDIGDFIECRDGGNPALGKTIFNTHVDAQCVRCHRVGKKGSTVGPNLKGVANRDPAKKDPNYLLRSIVAPSADIDNQYQTMMFLLISGKSVQGVVVRETDDEIVIADAAGEEIVINIDDIEAEKKQKLSIMPIANTLTKREIRDLVAYLNTLTESD